LLHPPPPPSPSTHSNTTNTDNGIQTRIDYFDGLRGWSAAAVVLHHIGAAMYGWTDFKDLFLQNHLGKILYFLFDGPFAVYIFFVLSGFVLSLGYMKNKGLRHLTGLVIRRAPRLSIPVAVSTIIIFLMLKAGCMFNIEAANQGSKVNTWLIQHYNFVPAVTDMIKSIPHVFLTGDVKYNIVLWTMRYEFFGSYYIVIFILGLHESNNFKKALVWVVSTVLLLGLEPRMACFNFGILIAFVYSDKEYTVKTFQSNRFIKLIILLFAIICYALNLVSGQLGFTIVESILSAAAAFFTVLSLIFVNMSQRIFSAKVSRFLGKISFPLYIVHMPVICAFTAFLMIKYPMYKENMITVTLIFFASALLSFLSAICFYPVEKLSVWFSRKIYSFMKS
jgi:peptidoglycan/LPS O-acetylase OafA/YrhL